MTTRKLGRKKNLVNQNEVWKVFVATPAYDGKVDVDYAMSMAEAAAKSSIFMVQFHGSMIGNGAFIDLARNMLVKQFLEDTDCTHLFFVDSDLKFDSDAFIGLIRSGLPICAGAYRRRQEPEDYPVKYAPHPEKGGLWVEEIDGIPWLQCERVPTGFLCIRRDVVEEMAAAAEKLDIHHVEGDVPNVFYTKLQPSKDKPGRLRFVGEDFAFCDDYRARYGKNISVFTNIDFVHGGYACNYHTYLEREIEKVEKAKDGGTSAA